MSHGGKRPGAGAKPKGPGGKNVSLRLYKSNRDMIAKWRERYGIDSDGAAVRHMMFVATMAVDTYGTIFVHWANPTVIPESAGESENSS
jgi:hypothetical protein